VYRQGDVLIVALDAIPSDQIQYTEIPRDAVSVSRGPHGFALADGKATGHTHRIDSEHASLYQLDGVRFLVVSAPVELVHEEHGTITIPPGAYRVTGHHEAQPGELPRQVED
jgi:hypothetical protein